MNHEAIKRAFSTSPRLKQALRLLLIPPLRTYFRYGPRRFGKKVLWKYIAAHLWWLESRATAQTEFGSTLHLDAHDLVGRYIYYFGLWEPNLTNWIRQRLHQGDVFIDVGANIGYYSLLASRLVGNSGKVVAVEALPQIFGTLSDNLKANCAYNVRPVNMAVWDKQERVRIFTEPQSPSGTTTLMEQWANRWELSAFCEVPAAPLPSILKDEEIKAARLIKIDVEGAEWRVISGMAPLMSACRDDLEIIVEIAPKMLEAEGKTCQDLLDLFRSWGFFPYHIENDYSAEAYFCPAVQRRPERTESIPTTAEQTDIIFSRVNAASL